MRLATRIGLAAVALVLASGAANAQNDVTFQVDLNPYITTCQFNPDENGVTTPGSMNDWTNTEFELSDDDSDGVYTGTYSLAEGDIAYKFYVTDSSVLSWENDPNREYTVVSGAQTIDVADFNGPAPEDNCSATEEDYEITFTVDMNVQAARGAFDPDTQVPGVAGAITDWGNGAVPLQPDAFTDGVYTGLVPADAISTPGESPYKFVILNQSDNSIAAWESGDNRLIQVTGDEPDNNDNDRLEATVPSRFFNDVTADQVLQDETSVTYSVDLNSAAFYLADNGSIPGTPEAATAINGLYINGPAMWESVAGGGPGDGITDWLAWGETGLGSNDDFAFSDDDGDNVWELTLTYPAGALRTLVGKLGINGADNEGGFGNDSFYPVGDGGTINLVFGAMLTADGTYRDDCGPDADADGNCDPIYDPYILVDNTATPPTVMAVDGTGTNDVGEPTANENGPGLARGVALGAPSPNPSTGLSRSVLSLDRAMTVRAHVVDLMGRVVATVAEGNLPAGETTLEFDASAMAAGVYVLRIEADGQVATRRVTVVR